MNTIEKRSVNHLISYNTIQGLFIKTNSYLKLDLRQTASLNQLNFHINRNASHSRHLSTIKAKTSTTNMPIQQIPINEPNRTKRLQLAQERGIGSREWKLERSSDSEVPQQVSPRTIELVNLRDNVAGDNEALFRFGKHHETKSG